MGTFVFDFQPYPHLMINGLPVNPDCVFRMSNTGQAVTTVLGNAASATIVALNSTTGVSLYIVSSSADDAVAGTGAQIVRVWGFNTAGKMVYEDISPVGTTGTVLTLTDWATAFFAQVTQAGSGGKAAGNIFIQDDAAGTTKYLAIPANGTQSSMCNFVLPSNVIAAFELTGYSTIGTTATDSLYVALREYTVATATTVQYMLPNVSVAANNTLKLTGKGFLRPGTKHDFYMDDIGTTGQTLNWSLTIGFKSLGGG